jgi:hypothetical protein
MDSSVSPTHGEQEKGRGLPAVSAAKRPSWSRAAGSSIGQKISPKRQTPRLASVCFSCPSIVPKCFEGGHSIGPPITQSPLHCAGAEPYRPLTGSLPGPWPCPPPRYWPCLRTVSGDRHHTRRWGRCAALGRVQGMGGWGTNWLNQPFKFDLG